MDQRVRVLTRPPSSRKPGMGGDIDDRNAPLADRCGRDDVDRISTAVPVEAARPARSAGLVGKGNQGAWRLRAVVDILSLLRLG